MCGSWRKWCRWGWLSWGELSGLLAWFESVMRLMNASRSAIWCRIRSRWAINADRWACKQMSRFGSESAVGKGCGGLWRIEMKCASIVKRNLMISLKRSSKMVNMLKDFRFLWNNSNSFIDCIFFTIIVFSTVVLPCSCRWPIGRDPSRPGHTASRPGIIFIYDLYIEENTLTGLNFAVCSEQLLPEFFVGVHASQRTKTSHLSYLSHTSALKKTLTATKMNREIVFSFFLIAPLQNNILYSMEIPPCPLGGANRMTAVKRLEVNTRVSRAVGELKWRHVHHLLSKLRGEMHQCLLIFHCHQRKMLCWWSKAPLMMSIQKTKMRMNPCLRWTLRWWRRSRSQWSDAGTDTSGCWYHSKRYHAIKWESKARILALVGRQVTVQAGKNNMVWKVVGSQEQIQI